MKEVKELLREKFGYEGFREGQERVVRAIMSGRDTLAVMPTGGGKSLCYQLPALLSDGITLVVSPLIALMNDQVSKLRQQGIPAAFLNSSQTYAERTSVLENAKQGKYKIIYVAPEKLLKEEFIAFTEAANISLLAVDEAHCISQWGNDFRPSYRGIADFTRKLSRRPVICAFTATATRQVRDDIAQSLNLQEPEIFVTGFDRPNLFFEVRHTGENKYPHVKRIVTAHKGEVGIVYCNTIKNVEKVCAALVKDGFSVCKYHADLSAQERTLAQDDFIQGRRPIIVATTAFGMGIDKPDIRYIVHCGMPLSLENYYQEAGRAGRDGKPSECILLYNCQDVETATMLIDLNLDKTPEEIRQQTMTVNYDKLRAMHHYCLTHDCLRRYILDYFGSPATDGCGHCSNCQQRFEEIDVADVARSIIGAVRESGKRFGASTIYSILLGEDIPRLARYNLPRNPYFGRLRGADYGHLKEVMEQILVSGHLTRPAGAYITIKTPPKSEEILSHDAVFKIKRRQ